MPASPVETNVRRRNGAGVIDMRGEINGGAEDALNAAYDEASAAASTVVLNFDGVDYINSTGIAVIVGLLARARTDARSITACGLVDHYREIFEVTRLADFMPIFGDEDSAANDAQARTA